MKRIAALALTLSVAGCAGSVPSQPAATTSAPAVSTAASFTDQVKSWVSGKPVSPDAIVSASEIQPGLLEVRTKLDDDHVTSGMTLCQAIVDNAAGRWSYVSILDEDDDAFVAFNHSRNPGKCAEV